MMDTTIGICVLIICGLCCAWCSLESECCCCTECAPSEPPDIHNPPDVEITVSPLV